LRYVPRKKGRARQPIMSPGVRKRVYVGHGGGGRGRPDQIPHRRGDELRTAFVSGAVKKDCPYGDSRRTGGTRSGKT